MMMEDCKKDINNILKEIQENTFKQVKELKKTIQDLNMEVETIKKSQRKTTLEIENLGKMSEAIDASITNRIQEIKERISGAEDTIENIDTKIKENAKCKKILTQNIKKNPGHNEKIKPKDNRYRHEGIFSTSSAIKYLQQNYTRKLLQIKEREAYEHTRSLQNSK
jgi:predicted  nucleic acid-binding Zn-ribbon protein